MFFPQCRVAGGAVPARVAARRDEHGAPVLHALDLALEDSELRRVALVVGGVDRDERRADAFQKRRRVVVVRGFPLIQDVVGVAAEGLREALRDDRVGLLARGRLLVVRLRSARGGDSELNQDPLHAARLRAVVAPVPLRVVADGVGEHPAQHPVAARHLSRLAGHGDERVHEVGISHAPDPGLHSAH